MNIKFENFSFKYKDMDRCILKDVSFSVCPGDFILLAGSSGGGKTTLLKCFKEEIRPKGETTGSIDLGDLGGQDIGFVFSDIDDQIVNDTVRGELAFGLENLGLSTDEIRRRLFYICNYFDIETWLDRKMDTLSSGQKQIINIASVMAMKPKVLILDSPDGALYPAARRRLYNILKDINKDFGTTIIIASHLSMEVIPFANKVFYLNDGRLAVYEDILEFKDYYLKEIANYKEEKNDKKNNEAENIVQIKNLWFRYNKFDKFILRDLSFDIKKGQISIIIGGNGSGKTTLLRIIGGFLKQAR
ncbi:MAG: ATP-binding cassette domain-containing protein, partial [Lachnospiraceae bacterium]|nr:ATP-binding cassette domain-containing protein [Lachnospiraceae bacterium]